MASSSVSGFDCPICTEVLLDPRALPCGHSFCGPPRICLDGIKIKDNNENFFQLSKTKCAVCNALFEMDVADLKPLYGIRDALKDVAIAKPERRSINQKGQPCVHTKGPLFWCDDCSFKLCLTCFEKSHSGHVIRSYNDFLTERGVKLVTMLGNVDLMILQISNEMKKLSTDKEKLNSYARTRDEIKKFLGRGDSHEKLSLEIKYLLETGFNAENFNQTREPEPLKFPLQIENIFEAKSEANGKTSNAFICGNWIFIVTCSSFTRNKESMLGLWL